MAKLVPNPDGKKGGIKHQQKIKEVINNLDLEGFKAVPEHYIPTPDGQKRGRFIDVVGFDQENEIQKAIQVGKTNAKGEPVKREQEAINDIEKASNLKIDFEDYEK